MTPFDFYQQQLQTAVSQKQILARSIKRLSVFRVFVAIGIALLLYFFFSTGSMAVILSAVLLTAIFLFMVKVQNSKERKQKLETIRADILEKEIGALSKDYSAFKNGAEFIQHAHPYSFDLDFFGDKSIYQMLCRTVTRPGAGVLADYLQNPYASQEAILTRQLILKELAQKPEFMIEFRVAGNVFEEGADDQEKIKRWLQHPDFLLHDRVLKAAAFILPALMVLMLVISVFQQKIFPGVYIVILLNWLILSRKSRAIKETAFYVAKNAGLIEKSAALVAVITQNVFHHPWLQKMREDSEKMSAEILSFKKTGNLFESRYNGMIGPLMNSLFLFDIYCVLRLEQWRGKNRTRLSELLDKLSDLDAQISFGTFAFNHPGYHYPVFNSGIQIMEAVSLAHPLLGGQAVGNDFSIGKDEKLYLLTGANMTGKSTFIRTIGVNLILAYLGLPLRARSASIPLVKLYTAIRITDSVQEDISYFKAELNRISGLMKEVGQSENPYLVMLDEPLRGTNTNDKQKGTRSIAEKLLRMSAIGLIATHDTVLCNLEESSEGTIKNYHFESQVLNGQLVFDYKLKPGCSVSNNATLLMEQLGIV